MEPLPPELIARLGTVVDRILAEEYCISVTTVAMYRGFLGIPPKRTELVMSPEVVAHFGTMTDLAIATKFGIKTSAVQYQRRKRGIAPYKKPLKVAEEDE